MFANVLRIGASEYSTELLRAVVVRFLKAAYLNHLPNADCLLNP